MIGYDIALKLTLEHMGLLDSEEISLVDATDRVAAENLYAMVNAPSVDSSLKDGYAIRSEDIQHATPNTPVRLKRIGVISPGMDHAGTVKPGTAVRILTGAKIPEGADAVVAEEYASLDRETVTVTRHAEPGRNILGSGSDVSMDELMVSKGTLLSPGKVGLLAASGHNRIQVYRRPRIAIIATGDEVVAPGQPLPASKLFASNLVTLNAWCTRYGMKTRTNIVRDDAGLIMETLGHAIADHDGVLTSGGAWTGDRDLVAKTLDHLGWEKVFHRIKLGPGKAVGFGLAQGKPVFILPGGPPSNLMAFLQIALPGLMKLSGNNRPGLRRMFVRLSETITGRKIDWTQFVFGRFEESEGNTLFHPRKQVSRLQAMAHADGIISIPEGVHQIASGEVVSAQILG